MVLRAVSSAAGGGGAVPAGGANTQIQYNNAGSLGGISTFTTDGTNITLALARFSVNLNTAAEPTVFSTRNVVITSADSTSNGFGVSAFSGTPSYSGSRSRGTDAIKAPVQNADVLVSFSGIGYGTTDYSSASRGNVQIQANQTWTDSVQGADVVFNATASGGTSTGEGGRVKSTGFQGAIGATTPAAGTFTAMSISASTSDAATITLETYTYGGNSHASKLLGQTTTGVAAVATTIMTTTADGTNVTVCGTDGTNRFSDIVLFGTADTPFVMATHTAAGAPAARTYTNVTGALKLLLATGTYSINVIGIAAGQR